MNDKDMVSQSQSTEPVETSKWAKRAIWCVGFGYLTPIALMLLIDILFNLVGNKFEFIVGISGIIIFFGAAILISAGLICGIIAIVKIALSKGKIKGIGKATASIILSVMYISIVCFFLIPAISRVRMSVQRDVRLERLSALGKSLKIYSDEHGAYLTADKWCDILSQGKYATEDIFKCPGNKKARCSYSMNPNCEPNSPPDAVLLFESKGGWNSYGGPDLFTSEHHKKKGGNILYNDCHVTFEFTEPNGHFKYELNWGEKGKRP